MKIKKELERSEEGQKSKIKRYREGKRRKRERGLWSRVEIDRFLVI
jgi:hypothetical protein